MCHYFRLMSNDIFNRWFTATLRKSQVMTPCIWMRDGGIQVSADKPLQYVSVWLGVLDKAQVLFQATYSDAIPSLKLSHCQCKGRSPARVATSYITHLSMGGDLTVICVVV